MNAHSIALDRLVPYADDALSLDQRTAVAGHVQGCAACARELQRVLQLNAVLDGFPSAPPANFGAFWLRLRPALRGRPVARRPFSVGRRTAIAFAMAALMGLSITTGVFAAETSLPDSPLYPVKRGEEQIQLALTFAPQARLQAQIGIANERLREARAMTGVGKDALASASLNDFNRVLAQIKPELNQHALASFELQLTALQQVSTLHEGEVRGIVPDRRHPVGLSGEPPQERAAVSVAPSHTPDAEPTAKPSEGDKGDHGGDHGHGGGHGKD